MEFKMRRDSLSLFIIIIFFWIRHKFYISTLYLYTHYSSFNYIVNAMDYNSECTKM